MQQESLKIKEDLRGEVQDHVQILANKIFALEIPSDLSIATETGARASLKYIEDLKGKVLEYQKVAKLLNRELSKAV